MQQPAMDPAVAVLERMNEGETEREAGRCDNRVQAARFALPGEFQKATHEIREVVRPRADMVWKRRVRVAIPVSHEAATVAPAKAQKAGVAANHDALQVQERVRGPIGLPSLAECLTPALDTILRRTFALDDVIPTDGTFDRHTGGRTTSWCAKARHPRLCIIAKVVDGRPPPTMTVVAAGESMVRSVGIRGLAILEQKERGGPGHQVRCGPGNHGTGLIGQIAREHGGQIGRPPDQRAKPRRPR